MTQDRRDGLEFDDDIAIARKHGVRFMAKSLTVWAALGFKTHKIDTLRGQPNG